ncbi:MAG TPA: tetratricopeptide repeat protein [Luteimonas sp.]|nr:tetratricopeptide repeat protein [Luteimonas sp.]
MAIDDLLDEHEQSERVLAWLRSNGAGLIGGVIVGLALILGWQWWRSHQATQGMQAGDDYQAMLRTLEAKDVKKAQSQAAALADTPYAPLAALDLAKAQLDDGQRDAAIATLRAAKSSNAALDRILHQRLARLLIDAGKADEALKVIGDADDAASLEVRGDAQVALGQRDEARKSYTEVLAQLDVASPARRLVELKLTDVGGSPAEPEAQS